MSNAHNSYSYVLGQTIAEALNVDVDALEGDDAGYGRVINLDATAEHVGHCFLQCFFDAGAIETIAVFDLARDIILSHPHLRHFPDDMNCE
jgi:hypothetical protein